MRTQWLNGLEHPDEIAELFCEYTDYLVAGDPVFASYLTLQRFDEELLHLDEKYGPPGGCLYLLRVDGENAAAAACGRSTRAGASSNACISALPFAAGGWDA